MTEEDPAAALAAGLADERCLHHLVEARATEHPDRVAVVCGEQRLTYAELNGRANRLARHLAGFGLGRPTVGLLLHRSVEFVVAALAVLKAGGNYVPLDADYPAERLRLMLDAARCPVVVSTTGLLAGLPQDAGVRTVAVDGQARDLAELPDDDLGLAVHPDDLAYTMFTSGSTGVPKGVMVTHRGVVRLVRPPGVVRLDGDDVVLHASSTSFDATTFDVWGALAGGARLVIAPAGRISTVDIAALMTRHRVTAVLLPTGLFHLMVDERLADLEGLRRLVVGGDVLSAKHARRFAQAVPHCELVNAYGPTEVTVATTTHRVSADHEDDAVPIGRAMPGTYVRLLDEDLRPVPAGEPGQLFAGGAGLARGYLGDPALTAERFVPDPWLAGARLYATGDLARLRPDGTLEFLGRMDDQFKKRGFRVEPGEVEAALRTDPAVRDAVVLADGATADTRRLVAVVLPAAGPAGRDLLDGVRSRLRGTLPEYLVPDLWAAVDGFPLTANGKVDRKALLTLATTGAVRHEEEGETEPAAEASGVEETTLAQIWQEILKVERVGREDDFFDLGGHSLLANKVVSQVRRRLGVPLPLDAVFDHPTIAGLAAVIRAERVAAGTP